MKTKNLPNYDNVRAALKSSNGKIFTVEFIKRTRRFQNLEIKRNNSYFLS